MIGLISAATVSVLFNNALGDDVYNSQELRGTFPITENVYVWGGYGEGKQDRLTQRMGSVQTFGGGFGLNLGGWFVEAGVVAQDFSSKERIAQEVAYHYFTRNFGTPPFANNWTEVEYKHETKPDLSVRIGYNWELRKDLDFQVAYHHYRPSEYWRIHNPNVTDPNAEGGKGYPYWEGNSTVNNSSFQIGLRWEF